MESVHKPVYGRRDAASVLMGQGHKVALIYRGSEGNRQWRIELDGLPVSMRELEDAAERYERLGYRNTERGNQ